MATIVTRAGKGSALTWTEGDANITNLNTAKIESANAGSTGQVLVKTSTGAEWQAAPSGGLTDVVNDTTPQLGGNLDVNGKSITSVSNGNIIIEPNGSGNIQITPNTGSIILGSTNWPTSTPSSGQVLTAGIGGVLSWSAPSGGSSALDDLSDVVITSAATNDVLVYNGTNWVDTAANTLTVSAASTATTATGATNINIASTDGNTSDTLMSLVLVGAQATGNQAPHIDAGLTYNASTNALTATTFVGALSGNATTATGATNINISTTNGNSGDTSLSVVLVGSSSTGNQAPHIDSGLTYNASSNILSAAGFDGTLNVDAYSTGTTVYIPLVDSTGAGQKTFSVGTTISANDGVISATQGFSGPIGASTASTGAFTTLSANSTVSGSGFTARFASPGPIGSTTASTGQFTTLAASGAVTLSPANLAVTISPTGTGTVAINPATIGNINNVNINPSTAGTGRFTSLTTTNTTASIVSESNGNISIQPNGTGQTVVKNLEYQEFVHALGTTSGTIAPNAANGNIQTITLNGNLTINAFTSPVSGQTITLIITTGGTGRTLTSTMLFAGGSKTLSTTSTTDILTISYIGTTYYASLVKGYA